MTFFKSRELFERERINFAQQCKFPLGNFEAFGLIVPIEGNWFGVFSFAADGQDELVWPILGNQRFHVNSDFFKRPFFERFKLQLKLSTREFVLVN